MLRIAKRTFFMMSLTVFFIVIATAPPLCAFPGKFSLDQPVLTNSGFVSGSVVTEYTDMNGNVAGQCHVHKYIGIPYAAAPVGDLRWKRPQAREPWSGIWPADKQFGPYCYQTSTPPVGAVKSEDCLYVNIYTPAKTSLERLPVMVWIHGGAFASGSASDPNNIPVNLARQGVVVVQINYRVHVFGWLAHALASAESPSGTSGNYGALDWMAGLDWIKRNIHAFGGDPKRVTIFGQSSGGDAIADLLVSPLSKGKFDRAIVESGTGTPTLPIFLESAENQGAVLAEKLGCTGTGALACLRNKTPDEILTGAALLPSYKWEHNVDGWLLPKHVFHMFESNDYNKDVPVIIGNTTEDSPGPAVMSTVTNYTDYLNAKFGDKGAELFTIFPVYDGMTAAEIKSAGNRVTTIYQTSTRAKYYAGIIQGKKHKPKAFVYEWGRMPAGFFPTHGKELAYLFGIKRGNPPQPVYGDLDFSMSAMLQQYWIQFAATGNPNKWIPNKHGNRLPKWPAYRQDSGQFLFFGDNVRTESTNMEAYGIFLDLIRDTYPTEP